MSLFGALKSGVSGLNAQSSAMSIISDNIANVNTIGYKANSASFSTLVTKQTSSTRYTSGGVQCRTRAGVDVQGLLSSTSYSTDLGISGNGFFVTTQTAQPSKDDLWSYTRVGTFTVDENGYLRNDNGYYLQAWPLKAFDGEENASLVQVGDNMFMKAYTDASGSTVYINDNIIDSDNMQPINLNTIGGTAQETQNISFGANLPADDPVFDPANPEAGGRHSSSVLIYDSLGNSHNAKLTFTKTENGTWSLDIGMPSGAATLITYSSSETTNDATQDVYSARAQMEFTSIPTNHSTISMETNGKNYVFEFTTDGTTTYSPKANEVVVPVDLTSGIVTVGDAVDKFNEVIQATLPSAGRFSVGADGTTLEVRQSNSGSAIKFKVSTTACLQSATNPDPVTGISTGEFELPEIDWDVKNTARIDFASDNLDDYLGKSVTIGTNTYVFSDTDAATSNGVVTVNISNLINRGTGKINTVKLVSLLKQTINDNEPDYDRYVASGSTLEINPSSTGANILVSSGNSASVTFQSTNIAAYVGQTVTIGDIAGGTSKTYKFTDNTGITSGTILDDGSIAVNISDLYEKDRTSAAPIGVMNALYNTMQAYYKNAVGIEDLSNYIQVSGSTMVSTSGYLQATSSQAELNKDTLTFTSTDINDYNGKTVTIDGTTYTFSRGAANSTTIDLDKLINTQTLTFANVPADGDTVTINGTTYTFVTGTAGTNEISIDTPALGTAEDAMKALTALAGVDGSRTGATLTLSGNVISENCANATISETVDPTTLMTALAKLAGVEEYQTGSSLVLTAYGTNAITNNTIDNANLTTDTTQEDRMTFGTTEGIGNALDIVGKDNGKQFNQPDTDGLLVVTNTFSFNNVEKAQSGSIIPAVSFNADGTPKEINTDKIAIEWGNGASDMTGNYYESSQINLYIGDTNTANGLTQLAGKFTTNYVTQDGAKYGNYTGVSISEDGIVTAIFDNGETRAIAQIPIATFVDANALEALTGNAYIETTSSGNATLRTAGEGGAGVISSNSLEESTVDIAEEFTDMITTQRAYSAASKIITTADSMLEELLTIKR
ncbi:MAG: flagellar hook-basal body complex protein [Alphaproteobacteria bacterium]|nr:flagellar hook-basal body complex protein [Alphaproteobacteria bacterium]